MQPRATRIAVGAQRCVQRCGRGGGGCGAASYRRDESVGGGGGGGGPWHAEHVCAQVTRFGRLIFLATGTQATKYNFKTHEQVLSRAASKQQTQSVAAVAPVSGPQTATTAEGGRTAPAHTARARCSAALHRPDLHRCRCACDARCCRPLQRQQKWSSKRYYCYCCR